MEWMLPVLGLALLWWWLRKKRPPNPEPKPLPDARLLLAEEMEQRAEAARREGRTDEAQVLALKSAWMYTHPKLGDDEPPAELDPRDGRHLRLAGDIWSRYREVRSANEDLANRQWLPYPREAIISALQLLLGIGDGTIKSPHVDSGDAPPEVLSEIRTALDELG